MSTVTPTVWMEVGNMSKIELCDNFCQPDSMPKNGDAEKDNPKIGWPCSSTPPSNFQDSGCHSARNPISSSASQSDAWARLVVQCRGALIELLFRPCPSNQTCHALCQPGVFTGIWLTRLTSAKDQEDSQVWTFPSMLFWPIGKDRSQGRLCFDHQNCYCLMEFLFGVAAY